MSESKTVAAGDFKAHCLKLMDEVRESGTEYVITKRGKPIARLVPLAEQPKPSRKPPPFGAFAGLIRVLDEDWSSDMEALGEKIGERELKILRGLDPDAEEEEVSAKRTTE